MLVKHKIKWLAIITFLKISPLFLRAAQGSLHFNFSSNPDRYVRLRNTGWPNELILWAWWMSQDLTPWLHLMPWQHTGTSSDLLWSCALHYTKYYRKGQNTGIGLFACCSCCYQLLVPPSLFASLPLPLAPSFLIIAPLASYYFYLISMCVKQSPLALTLHFISVSLPLIWKQT